MFLPDVHIYKLRSKLHFLDLWQVQVCLKGFIVTLLLFPFVTHFLQMKMVSQLGHSLAEQKNLHFVLLEAK